MAILTDWRFLALVWGWIPDWLLWPGLAVIAAGLALVVALLVAIWDDRLARRDEERH